MRKEYEQNFFPCDAIVKYDFESLLYKEITNKGVITFGNVRYASLIYKK